MAKSVKNALSAYVASLIPRGNPFISNSGQSPEKTYSSIARSGKKSNQPKEIGEGKIVLPHAISIR